MHPRIPQWAITLPVLLLVVSPVPAQVVMADFDDLKQVPAAKKLLDDAAAKLRQFAQGNESGVSVKRASGKNVVFDVKTGKPLSGQITVVFDLHHRHRTTSDGEIRIFGKPLPGIVPYDRHDEVLVEYDIKAGRGKARLAKGPLALPLLPMIDWELWINVEIKK